MKTHTSSFKEQIKLIGKEIDSRITFGSTVLGKDDLNAVTPSYQGAILKSVMKQLDIDSNVEIPIGTILKYEFGLKVNGEYEYINYGNYVVYSIEKQEDTNSYKITCYDKLLYSMLDYVKLPITYPISIRDYINSLSTALGLKFANKSETFANYDKQIQADLYDGLGYTFRDVLDELAQVTASTICLNNNDELEIRYITETNDTIDEEFLKDVNVNFGEKFGAVNTIVLSRSGDSDSVYYPSVLPSNPYEIKISDNQIMNGNDRADFLPDIYNKLNGLEFYTNDFVSKGICYYDLCDRYSVKVGDNTYSCVMFNDEVLVTQGLEENVYTELPEQTETDYKHASKDDRMINQVYIIAKKNEAEILALVSTTETIQKEINPTKDESGSEIIIEDASNNPLTYLEIDGKSTQATRRGKNLFNKSITPIIASNGQTFTELDTGVKISYTNSSSSNVVKYALYKLIDLTNYVGKVVRIKCDFSKSNEILAPRYCIGLCDVNGINRTQKSVSITSGETISFTVPTLDGTSIYLCVWLYCAYNSPIEKGDYVDFTDIIITMDNEDMTYEPYGVSPSPDYPSEIESVGTYNEETGKYQIEVKNTGKNLFDINTAKLNSVLKLSDGTYVTENLSVASDFIKIEKGKSYISKYKMQIILFNENKEYIGYYNNTTAAYNEFTISNESECNYVKVAFRSRFNNNVDFTTIGDIQLEKGSTATDYEPYQQNTSLFVLDQPLRSLPNGVKDELVIENGRAKIIKNVGKYNITGNEAWALSGTESQPYINFGNYVDNCKYPATTTELPNLLSNYYLQITRNNLYDGRITLSPSKALIIYDTVHNTSLANFKEWLKSAGVVVYYQLATPTEIDLGEVEMPSTYKGTTYIQTTDNLEPNLNITYVRDTVISDYVENHVAELKITESEIKSSVETVSSSVDGLNSTVNRVEEITNDNSQVLNIISTNIDRTSGEVREVTTTTGFTFNAEGMAIADGSGFKAQHTAQGTFYKDGDSITGQYTKDGSKQKDLELFGTYSYGKNDINDTPMFVAQLYIDEKGEECFGHFINI